MLLGCAYLCNILSNEYRIKKEGVVTTAQVVKKYTSMTQGVTAYHLVYVFKSGNSERLVTSDGTTNKELYDNRNLNDSVTIRYLASDPESSEPWQGDNTGRIKGAILLLVMGILATVKYAKDAQREEERRGAS